MKDDHREKAIVALTRFRKEVREAGFSEDELADIMGHVSALEDEVKAPKPDQAAMKSSTDALEEVSHSPEVTDAIARVVRFFNSIGILVGVWLVAFSGAEPVATSAENAPGATKKLPPDEPGAS